MLLLLTALKLELEQLAEKIDRSDASIMQIARENEACQRLVAMPGLGPVTATAIIATIGNGAAFCKGRDFAAWLGVIPEEHSTGGKQTLWRIPLRGNQYLRKLFVQGARCRDATPDQTGARDLSAWLARLTARTHHNVASLRWPTSWHASPGRCWRKRSLPTTASSRCSVPVTGLQMTPGEPGLEIAAAIPTSADHRRTKFKFPARSAGEERDGTTVEPSLGKTCYR